MKTRDYNDKAYLAHRKSCDLLRLAILRLEVHCSPADTFSGLGAILRGAIVRRRKQPCDVSLRIRGASETQAVSKENRSEEHTSELQSRENLVCRLLLEKKKLKEHC